MKSRFDKICSGLARMKGELHDRSEAFYALIGSRAAARFARRAMAMIKPALGPKSPALRAYSRPVPLQRMNPSPKIPEMIKKSATI